MAVKGSAPNAALNAVTAKPATSSQVTARGNRPRAPAKAATPTAAEYTASFAKTNRFSPPGITATGARHRRIKATSSGQSVLPRAVDRLREATVRPGCTTPVVFPRPPRSGLLTGVEPSHGVRLKPNGRHHPHPGTRHRPTQCVGAECRRQVSPVPHEPARPTRTCGQNDHPADLLPLPSVDREFPAAGGHSVNGLQASADPCVDRSWQRSGSHRCGRFRWILLAPQTAASGTEAVELFPVPK